MSVASQIHGLKYFAPIAMSRLYEQRALFSYATAVTPQYTYTPRPSIHMPKLTSPESLRVWHDKPRPRAKTEKSPTSKSNFGLVSRHGCDAEKSARACTTEYA